MKSVFRSNGKFVDVSATSSDGIDTIVACTEEAICIQRIKRPNGETWILSPIKGQLAKIIPPQSKSIIDYDMKIIKNVVDGDNMYCVRRLVRNKRLKSKSKRMDKIFWILVYEGEQILMEQDYSGTLVDLTIFDGHLIMVSYVSETSTSLFQVSISRKEITETCEETSFE